MNQQDCLWRLIKVGGIGHHRQFFLVLYFNLYQTSDHPLPDAEATSVELAKFAAENIDERPACPKEIHVLDELPRTAVGKIFKPALRAECIKNMVQELIDDAGLDSTLKIDVQLTRKGQAFISAKITDDDQEDKVRDLAQ